LEQGTASACDIPIKATGSLNDPDVQGQYDMQFAELRLSEPIVRAVAAEGYITPTPIQRKAIPEVLDGRDLLGCAQTGTGKTGAFAMPMLHMLAQGQRPNPPKDKRARKDRFRGSRARGSARPCMPRALVLSPTRELATQIFESFRTYGCNLHLRHAVIFGGVSQSSQVRAMRGGVDVIVATPGRLLDLMRQGIIDTSAIQTLVLDEADHMLDMGFIQDIRRIIEQVPTKRQTLFFSATMPPAIRSLADAILTDPVCVETDPVASTVDTVDQSVYMVPHRNKSVLLERLIRRQGMARTLVFTRTKRGADKLVVRLQRSGVEAAAIHGNKNQNARTRALDAFKSGSMPVLVATDIAARGIDVANVTHVVNYDIPNVSETYVHRIGRTARAGADGIALSLCDREERRDLKAIERLIQQQLDIIACDDDLQGDAPTESTQQQRNRSPRSGKSPARRPSGSRDQQRAPWKKPTGNPDRPQRRGTRWAETRSDDTGNGRSGHTPKPRFDKKPTEQSSPNKDGWKKKYQGTAQGRPKASTSWKNAEQSSEGKSGWKKKYQGTAQGRPKASTSWKNAEQSSEGKSGWKKKYQGTAQGRPKASTSWKNAEQSSEGKGSWKKKPRGAAEHRSKPWKAAEQPTSTKGGWKKKPKGSTTGRLKASAPWKPKHERQDEAGASKSTPRREKTTFAGAPRGSSTSSPSRGKGDPRKAKQTPSRGAKPWAKRGTKPTARASGGAGAKQTGRPSGPKGPRGPGGPGQKRTTNSKRRRPALA
jgi:ATP-dependent RNA helicase RhlE